MHASLLSPASVYKTFDHVFIAHVLSPSGAVNRRYQVNSIFVRERFHDVLQTGWMRIARNPRVRRSKAAPSHASICTMDSPLRMQPEKCNAALTSCKDVIHIVYTSRI